MIHNLNNFVNESSGSSLNFSAHGWWGKRYSSFVFFCIFRHAVPPKSFGGEAQADGQKGRGLRGRNFFPLVLAVPVPFEQEKSGRRVWGNSAFLLPNQNEASPATLQLIARHHRKILFSLGEEESRCAQHEKSKEYFSVVWRALASGGGAASFIRIRLVKNSDFVQERQPFFPSVIMAFD